MKLKVQLQITGTIEEAEAAMEPATEGQVWRLVKEGLPEFIVALLTKGEAGKLVGAYEQRKNTESYTRPFTIHPVMESFVKTIEEKESAGEEVELPFNDKPAKPLCMYTGCKNVSVSKGLCQKHYMVEYKKLKRLGK